ncbi:flavodoxin family protein [Desulfoluna spongiiphila]|uniref:NADPH-dependent FMN reductase n=1 Tax=Desulfoluna spongiiphila TaxID=419481 RepID=A0A1G5FKJ2_9BACT|nr:flavodoxin family protein [Desulfoluna spongiiphila]SCY39776.1 NADPH-dependent FMN reductase [Desulfoluna spongiiphila]
MKILTLLGSARKKGNTACILGWVEEELKALGHEVERVDLGNKKINGCLGCAKCKENTKAIDCIQKDDAEGVLEKMIAADVTLFTSPAYFWGFTAQVKALMDRSWSLVSGFHTPKHTSLVEGKSQALLVTGGGQYDNNVEPLFTAFGRLRSFYKAEDAGDLFIGGCTIDGQRPEDAKERALAFARAMVK